MKSIKNTNLKVGDRVKWSGEYIKFINGYTNKTAKEYIHARRIEIPGFLGHDWIMANSTTVKRKGINTIKSIKYCDLFEEVVITLRNGKIFETDTDLILIK